MNKVIVCEETNLIEIADAIREMQGVEDKYYLHEMPNAIRTIFSETMDEEVIYPGVEDRILPAKTYLKGPVTIKGDEEFIPSNIGNGVEILGITGTRPHYTEDLLISTSANVTNGTVTAISGENSYTTELINGEAFLSVPHDGIWTLNAISGERVADTVNAELKSTDTVKLLFFEATVGCYVMGDVEVTVTCTNGEKTYTSTGVGEHYFTVYERGVWTVSCVIEGTTWSGSFNVQEHKKKYIEIFNGEPDAILNNNSWTLISIIASTGLAENYWSIGDTKEIVLNGTAGVTTYDNVSIWAQIIGFNHNPGYEGESSIHFQIGTTAQTSGVQVALIDGGYGTSKTTAGYFNMNYSNSNSGGWASSKMRTVMLPELETVLPADLTAVIKVVNKYTDNVGGGSGHVEENVSVTEERLFLPSYYEVFGGTSTSYANSYENGVTKQYSYYSAGNSKVRYRHSATTSTCYWWLRSPRYSFSSSFCSVYTGGNAGSYGAGISLGCAPCFRL